MAKILGEMITREGSLTADFRDKARLSDLHSRLSSLRRLKRYRRTSDNHAKLLIHHRAIITVFPAPFYYKIDKFMKIDPTYIIKLSHYVGKHL